MSFLQSASTEHYTIRKCTFKYFLLLLPVYHHGVLITHTYASKTSSCCLVKCEHRVVTLLASVSLQYYRWSKICNYVTKLKYTQVWHIVNWEECLEEEEVLIFMFTLQKEMVWVTGIAILFLNCWFEKQERTNPSKSDF